MRQRGSVVSRKRRATEARSIVEAVISPVAASICRSSQTGVETEQQLLMLTEQGFTQAQGYLIGRPLPIAHFQIGAAKSCDTYVEILIVFIPIASVDKFTGL